MLIVCHLMGLFTTLFPLAVVGMILTMTHVEALKKTYRETKRAISITDTDLNTIDCVLPITTSDIFQSHIHCFCNMLNY